MSLTLRTIKISLAAFIAILVANFVGLSYSVSAGIIAILSVLDTNKSSWLTAIQRVISTVLALGTAGVLFHFLGFETHVFAIYLLVYVPLAYKLGVESGVAPCSVLVTHLLLEESVAWSWISNELFLMLIGAGIAILVNLYMPSNEGNILALMNASDKKMKDILVDMSDALLRNSTMTPTELDDLETMLDQASDLVLAESENRPWKESHYYLNYFEMRKNQNRVLRYIQQNISLCTIPVKEGKILSGLLYLTADQLHEFNTGEYLLEDIRLLLEEFRNSELPQSRSEFENRALLFQILNDFTRFIQIKKSFYDEYGLNTKK
ncbi:MULTISPECIES: aromatic acid exporter family protein [unclassified Jeotgalibaca]|uniref:aromatic acid exporter family protein n=1 Tax=unclassified Jeotgalibaca TaxID=2621505 RepID=UPI003FCF7347